MIAKNEKNSELRKEEPKQYVVINGVKPNFKTDIYK